MAKLRGKMTEKGFTQMTLAEKVQIDRSTLNRKMKTGENFTIEEANRIAKTLELTGTEAIDIFFATTVA